MNDGNTVALAAIAALGTCVGLISWVMHKVLGDIGPAIKSMDNYLRERNGRDNEMHQERMQAHEQMMRQEQKFFKDMVTHMRDLKESDRVLANTIVELKRRSRSRSDTPK